MYSVDMSVDLGCLVFLFLCEARVQAIFLAGFWMMVFFSS